jgi:gamma-polyglutamate biosynthesis protein CapC
MELLAISVGIGLVIGILMSEVLGIASAGLIVPGYLALYLMRPLHLGATLLVAAATYGIVRALGSLIILHGRRRSVMILLVGYVLGLFVNQWSGVWIEDFATIGFIIPGLIALWMDKQGVVPTLSSLTIVTVAVRLVLVAAGAELRAT